MSLIGNNYPNKDNNVCPRCIHEDKEVFEEPCSKCRYLTRLRYLEEKVVE